jgi:hypothetical protein
MGVFAWYWQQGGSTKSCHWCLINLQDHRLVQNTTYKRNFVHHYMMTYQIELKLEYMLLSTDSTKSCHWSICFYTVNFSLLAEHSPAGSGSGQAGPGRVGPSQTCRAWWILPRSRQCERVFFILKPNSFRWNLIYTDLLW